jgi:hypothetical protein
VAAPGTIIGSSCSTLGGPRAPLATVPWLLACLRAPAHLCLSRALGRVGLLLSLAEVTCKGLWFSRGLAAPLIMRGLLRMKQTIQIASHGICRRAHLLRRRQAGGLELLAPTRPE